jgi:hypothetical protein
VGLQRDEPDRQGRLHQRPSRLEEQSWGVEGPYAGYAHHHWLVTIEGTHVEFAFKAHDLHASPRFHFPEPFVSTLTPEDRLQELGWEGSFTWAQRVLAFPGERHAYFADFVARETARRPPCAEDHEHRALAAEPPAPVLSQG